jgi:glucosamine 6-phosphate synthetase-like amidotransferase/phosphosugar isomerase protein
VIDDGIPVVVITPRGKGYDKVLSNLAEVRAREGAVIAVATSRRQDHRRAVPMVVWVPDCPALLQPLLTVLPLQMLAYEVALARGKRRRPAAEPGQERDGRVTGASSPPVGDGQRRTLSVAADGG